MGKVLAVCSSEARGTPKKDVGQGLLTPEWGLVGDAHGGLWHRQISLLGADKIDDFNARGGDVAAGAFGENLVVSGFDFRVLPVGALLRCGDVLLEITQIGKECHNHCEIYHRVGDCIMPREGVFARVIESGRIAAGDEMTIEERTAARPWQAAVITLSDKGAAGQREDKSGPAVSRRLIDNGYEVIETLLLSDDQKELEQQLVRLCDQRQPDLILTTGGTGFSSRDHAPEATLAVAHRQAPGIAEAIRAASMAVTPHAMLSRAVSVIRGKTLIINLPGSPKATMECMDVFLGVIPHAMGLLRSQVSECARTD